MTALGDLLEQLDPEDLRNLAERLKPYLPAPERADVRVLMTVTEAAKMLGVHPKTVRRRIADRSLPAVVEHGRTMLRTDELQAYIEGLERTGARPTRRRRSVRSPDYGFLRAGND